MLGQALLDPTQPASIIGLNAIEYTWLCGRAPLLERGKPRFVAATLLDEARDLVQSTIRFAHLLASCKITSGSSSAMRRVGFPLITRPERPAVTRAYPTRRP